HPDKAPSRPSALSLHDALPISGAATHRVEALHRNGGHLPGTVSTPPGNVLWATIRVRRRIDQISLKNKACSFSRFRQRGRRDCRDRKSTRLNSSHVKISYAVFC